MPTVPLTRLQVLQGRLDRYLEAEAEILKAQQYQVGDGATARELLRARLDHVLVGMADVQGQINVELAVTTGRRGVLYLR